MAGLVCAGEKEERAHPGMYMWQQVSGYVSTGVVAVFIQGGGPDSGGGSPCASVLL